MARSRSTGSGPDRIAASANVLASDNQTLIADIRKATGLFKELAVEMEKDGKTEMVKQLEENFLELLETYENCATFSEAIQAVGNNYEPKDEPTDFKKLLEEEAAKRKAESQALLPKNNPLYRQFKEAIWNVHHAGQPMPGEEHEDIIMTSTQCNILNPTCPLTGKPVTQLENPVRSMDCKHVYEKAVILSHIRKAKGNFRCPCSGCPKNLQAERVICDPLLLIEIEEMRGQEKATTRNTSVEDCTDLNDDE